MHKREKRHIRARSAAGYLVDWERERELQNEIRILAETLIPSFGVDYSEVEKCAIEIEVKHVNNNQ